jgi:hypothetical protein
VMEIFRYFRLIFQRVLMSVEKKNDNDSCLFVSVSIKFCISIDCLLPTNALHVNFT